MNPRTAFFIQGILEAAIPVYGYFEWNWDLSFILLFYFIDWILSLILAGLKGRKRFDFSKQKDESLLLRKRLLQSVLLAVAATVLFAFVTLNVKPGMSWMQRITDFMLYKEMGIQQGFILIPLIVLNGFMLYKQQFITPKLFEKLDMTQIVQPVMNQNLLLFALSGVFLGITSLISVHETVIVFAIIAVITIYRMIFIRNVISYGSR